MRFKRRRAACERFACSLRLWVSVNQASNSSGVQVRCGSRCRSRRVICGRVIWGSFFPPVQLQTQQEGSGQQGHGDVMLPAQPGAHFVLIETGFALLGLKLSLDGPAHGPDLRQPQQGRVCGRIRQVDTWLRCHPDHAAGPASRPAPADRRGFPRPAKPQTDGCAVLAHPPPPSVRATRRGQAGRHRLHTLGPGSPATSWSCVGLRPRPDQAGTATWAACVKTCVVLGTSST